MELNSKKPSKCDFENIVNRITSKQVFHALNIQSVVVHSFIMFMDKHNIRQLTPLMLAAETDPLNHTVFATSIH